MKELRFTLYDICGYLLPGIITLLAILVVVWGESWREVNFDAIVRLSPNEIGLLVLIAYFLGHAMQALGNFFEEKVSLKICDVRSERMWPRFPRWLIKIFNWSLGVERYGDVLDLFPDAVLSKFYEAFSRRFDLDGKKLKNSKEIYKLCDAALLREGSVEEREIHSYREGFYRGTFVALVFVLASTILLFRSPGVEIIAHSRHFHSSSHYFYLPMGLSAMCVVLSFHRYRKFRKLRISNCFARFIASMTSQELKVNDPVPAPLAKAKSA